MNNKPRIFAELERLAPLIPTPMSWVDTEGLILGGNDLIFQVTGSASIREQIIGKPLYKIYPEDIAKIVIQRIKQVVEEKRIITFEESIKDMTTGGTRWFLVTRAPLFDDDEVNVIGVVGTSVEITDRKELEQERIKLEQERIKTAQKEAQLQEQEKFKKIVDQAANDTKSPITILLVLVQQCSGFTKEQVFEKLKTYATSVPVNLYWLDVDNKIIGANKQTIEAIGGKVADDYIGKTPYEFYPHDTADRIVKHNREVMRIKKVLSQEEPIVDITSGETKYFTAFKAPLFDEKGNVIGVVGTSVDITAEKTAKRLVLENERQRTEIMEQQKFASIAAQVFHDIRSPLASITMTANSCKSLLPENTRITLLSAVTSVETIANDLLSEYHKKGHEEHGKKEEREPILISLTLLELLTDKRHQYKNLPIKFEHDFSDNSHFVFTKAKPSAFKRMISNLVNNAVDAFEGKEGKVVLKLISDDIQAKIIIEDNGKGIPKDILNKGLIV